MCGRDSLRLIGSNSPNTQTVSAARGLASVCLLGFHHACYFGRPFEIPGVLGDQGARITSRIALGKGDYSSIINCLQDIKRKEYACLHIVEAWARAFLKTFLTTFYESESLAEEH